jgi:hypothetical protein
LATGCDNKSKMLITTTEINPLENTMKINIFLKHLLLLSAALLSTGCGNTNSSSSGISLMGGAIQGKELSLTGSVSTLAGIAGNQGSSDGNGVAARFAVIGGATTDGTNIYVADSVNGTIRKIVIATGDVSTFAGTAGANGSTDGIGIAARFGRPIGITTDGTNLYATDTNTVRKISISTRAVTTLAGTAGSNGSSDGTGAAARFGDYLPGITSHGAYLYVPDFHNQTIRKIDISTGVVTTLAGTVGNQGGFDGIGATASFCTPTSITTDGTNLFLTDDAGRMIRKFVIATGATSTLAGVYGSSASFDGFGSTAMFVSPAGITTDGTNLYITDQPIINDTITPGIMSIRKLVIATGEVTTLAVNNGLNDVAGVFAFTPPIGITTDGTNLFIVNRSGSSINQIH